MAKGVKTGGRQPGSLNKATREFRDTVTKLLSDNAENVAKWLDRVATGTEAVLDAEGKIAVKGVAPDPGKALDLLASLAEYAAPKLARTELTGPDGGPVQTATSIDVSGLTNEQLRALASIAVQPD